MKRTRKAQWKAILAGLLCLLMLAACGPASGATATNAPAEPARVTDAPPSAQNAANTPDAGLTHDGVLHITWMYNPCDPQEAERDRGVLQEVLNRSGWPVYLDVLPEGYHDNPGGYATDAFLASPASAAQMQPDIAYADAEKLYLAGITQDMLQLCARYAPVLAEKYAGLLSPAGIPLYVQRHRGTDVIGLSVRRDKVPLQWLSTPPTITEIVAWIETDGVTIGYGTQDSGWPQPFPAALSAWAGEQRYYPLHKLGLDGGFYAKADDPTLQPVPLEDIDGFEEMYARLVALFNAGKYYEQAALPAGTDGYICLLGGLSDAFLQANGITADDVVAIPVRDTAWKLQPDTVELDRLLAIPKGSQHAERVIKLVEWVLTTREGYDLVNYGIQGEDYTLQGERLQQTKDGRTDTLHGSFARDSAMERIRVNSPANMEELLKWDEYVPTPAMGLENALSELFGGQPGELQTALEAIRQSNDELISARENLLMGLMPVTGDNAKAVTDADQALKLLNSYRQQTAELALAYAAKLRQAMK